MEAAERDSDALCTRCGLCCDGTFYGSVVIAAPERERLKRVGLRVVESDGGLAMPQPCSALGGSLCAVYETRPDACARYECTLRKRVRAGESTLEDAERTVARMRELLSSIRAAFDCPDATSIWERILALEEPATAEQGAVVARDYAAAIDAVGTLLELGREHFEPRFAGGASR